MELYTIKKPCTKEMPYISKQQQIQLHLSSSLRTYPLFTSDANNLISLFLTSPHLTFDAHNLPLILQLSSSQFSTSLLSSRLIPTTSPVTISASPLLTLDANNLVFQNFNLTPPLYSSPHLSSLLFSSPLMPMTSPLLSPPCLSSPILNSSHLPFLPHLPLNPKPIATTSPLHQSTIYLLPQSPPTIRAQCQPAPLVEWHRRHLS